ncbi:MAG: hypothetical protein ABI867_24155 [Kofleriaceae bacterium]
MADARARWFAEMLHAGLATRVLSEQDILVHATPAILIAALPREVMARVFGGALTAGAISPKAVVETATPELLAEKVPAGVIWDCLSATADRAGIPQGSPKDEVGGRELLRRALASGLETGVLTPAEIVHHVDAKVLGHSFPDDLTTKLLEASLAAGKMNPELIVETLGTDAIAKHAPTDVVWAILVKPGEALEGVAAATSAVPVAIPLPVVVHAPARLEFVDDDVSSVLVDLEESTLDAMIEKAPAPAPALTAKRK